MPSGALWVNVVIFIICALTCLLTLTVRRRLLGGELGCPALSRWPTFTFFALLRIAYLVIGCWMINQV